MSSHRGWAALIQPDSGRVGLHADSVADVIERLFSEFEKSLGLSVVVEVVSGCRRDLDVVSGPQMPEMLERLAHARLGNLRAQNFIQPPRRAG